MTKSTRTMPVTATTVFLPIEEKIQRLNAFEIPGEVVVEAEETDIWILD
jgi:hypothetical protein